MDAGREKQIISLVKAGETGLFIELVKAYQNQLYNLAFTLTADSSRSEEIVQETFLRAYAKLAGFNSDGSFFSWLYAICLNRTRVELKKLKRLRLKEDSSERAAAAPCPRPGPDQEYDRRERSELVRAAVRNLPASLGEAVALRFFQDLSFEQAAMVLGISTQAAKMRVYRGVARLAEMLPGDVSPVREAD